MNRTANKSLRPALLALALVAAIFAAPHAAWADALGVEFVNPREQPSELGEPGWMRLAFDRTLSQELSNLSVAESLVELFDRQPDWRNMTALAQAPPDAPVDVHESTLPSREYLTPGLAPLLVEKPAENESERPIAIGGLGVTSSIISQHDYSDTFTASDLGGQPGRWIDGSVPLKSPATHIEFSYDNPPQTWQENAWGLVRDGEDGGVWDSQSSPYPGSSGRGTQTGFVQARSTGENTFGIYYGLRDIFVVQFDAVQTSDWIALSIGDAQAKGNIHHPSALTIFFRPVGAKMQISLYNSEIGEFDTGLTSGIPRAGQWHNYGALFDLVHRKITVYVDELPRGTILLGQVGREELAVRNRNRNGVANGNNNADANAPGVDGNNDGGFSDSGAFAHGAFAGFVPGTGSITLGGLGGDRLWVDNFQVGGPGPTKPPENFASFFTMEIAAFDYGGGGYTTSLSTPFNPDPPPPPSDDPPPPIPPGPLVPAPAALPSGLLLLSAFGALRRYRRRG